MTPARGSRPGRADGDREPDDEGPGRDGRERKAVLLRLDPAVHAALARWAADEVRSVNGQIDFLLRRSLSEAGRLPRDLRPPRSPGRPAGTEDG